MIRRGYMYVSRGKKVALDEGLVNVGTKKKKRKKNFKPIPMQDMAKYQHEKTFSEFL